MAKLSTTFVAHFPLASMVVVVKCLSHDVAHSCKRYLLPTISVYEKHRQY